MINSVNKKISTPIYQQVKELILHQIKNGKIKPGEKIPSESQLCNIYNISRISVRQAIVSLANDGLLYTTPGKGTFVSDIIHEAQLEYIASFKAEARKKGFSARINVLEEKIIKADKEIVEYLKIKHGDKVIKIKRVKIANNIPIYTELRFIPYKYCPSLIEEGLADKSLTELAKNKYNLKITSRDIVVTPIALDFESAMLLRAEEGSPALFVTETLLLDNGSPFKWEQRIHKSSLHFTTKAILD